MKIIQSFNHSIRFNYLRILKVAFFATFILFVTSCRLDEDIKPEAVAPINTEGQTKLGKKLENPYTVENMRKAQENLRAAGQNSEFNVRPTHLYIKFNPQDEEELDLLKSDTTLELYDYPLDYEIEAGSVSYHDPTIPIGKPTYQYVAVKVDKKLPRLAYEVLAKLYIPEEDGQITNGRGATNPSVAALVDEALRITNNLEEGEQTEKVAKNARKYTASGTIRVWDDVVGETTITEKEFDHWEYYPCDDGDIIIEKIVAPAECKRPIYRYVTRTIDGSIIPIEGVKVRARRWFTIHKGFTDANGNYTLDGSFTKAANFSIKWERAYYDIRNGVFGQAYYNGPKQKGNWSLNITGGKSLRFATIHRAAHRYYYKNIGGMNRPNIFLVPFAKLKFAYIDTKGPNDSDGVNWGVVGIGWPTIKIWGKRDDNNQYHFTNALFSTTIHEIAHTSHIMLMNAQAIQYVQVSKIIRESWADAVEWHITRIEYVERGEVDYDNLDENLINGSNADHKQWWDSSDNHEYTPVFIDLIDDYNQNEERGSGPNDDVTGYTMGGIESGFLKHVYGLASLKNELRNHKPSGVTNQQIDEYLAYFFDL